jgi:hypothetical protein
VPEKEQIVSVIGELDPSVEVNAYGLQVKTCHKSFLAYGFLPVIEPVRVLSSNIS